MLEESISCSPGCETNRSQSRRLHKRLKRKYRRRKDSTPALDVTCLEGLYDESTDALNSTQYQDFNPFENEKFLAAADMVRVPKLSLNTKDLPLGGFVKLEDIPVRGNDEIEPQIPDLEASPLSKSESHPQCGPETQFGITESEFVRFCDDAEMDGNEPAPTTTETPKNKKTIVDLILEDFCGSQSSESSSNSIPEEDIKESTMISSQTPRNKKSIVEAILEDFCASPYSESPPKYVAENSTPIFHFRSKAIRTYVRTRRRSLRRNIEDELANAHLTDDDGNVSDSSGLSVQEDLTQSVVPQLDTVDLNSSIKVCENLLNLSSYFSQTTSHDKTPQPSEETQATSHERKSQFSEEQKSKQISEMVQEIMQLKRKSHEITRRQSEDEFHGFSDGDSIEEFYGFPEEERDSNRNAFKELLEAEDDILQEINCDSLCYEQVQPKSSFSYEVSGVGLDLENAKSVIEDADKFMQSLENLLDAEVSSKSKPVCDSLKILQRKLSHDSSVKEEKLFEDVDLWNDNECLLNYVTQKPNSSHGKCISEEQTEAEVDTSKSLGFSTASRKPIAISEEGRRKADAFLSKFEKLEMERGLVDNEVKAISVFEKESLQPSCSKSDFLGFTTASKKPVVISEAARLKADQILKQFEQDEEEQRLPEEAPLETTRFTSTVSKPSISRKNGKDGGLVTDHGKDGRLVASTRNEKHRQLKELSDEVKQKAEELLKNIEFDDGFGEEEAIEEFSNLNACNEVPSAFEGFKTASRKPIAISKEAKRRADRLIKEIQTEDIPKDFLECIQAEHSLNTAPKSPIKEESKVDVTFEGFKTASKKPIQISDVAKRRAEQILNEIQSDDLPKEFLECIQADLKDTPKAISEQQPRKVAFEGFKTASKKPIAISEVAKQRAGQIIKEIQTTELPQDFIKCIQADLNENSTSVAEKRIFEGFETASRKPIQISDAAKQRAEELLKDIQSDDLPPDFVEVIQSKSEAEVPAKSERNEIRKAVAEKPIFEGFKTASRKQIQISDAAKQRAEELLKDIQSDDLPPDVVEVTQSKSEVPEVPPKSERNEIHHSFSQEPPSSNISPQKTKEPDNRKAIKRKSADDLLKSPKRRFSCNDRTPLNGIENALLHKTSSHPQIKSSLKSSKKNLLSLSKRKKSNSPKPVAVDTSAVSKTPEKLDSSVLRCTANTTPNLKEFFNCVTTSTPRLIRANSTKVGANPKDSSMDGDFQRINWENTNNNSARACKTSSFADLNVTCVEVSPSPKQRIERLKMYGEPPPISPILMVNRCRPSGLRRGRSLMKP